MGSEQGLDGKGVRRISINDGNGFIGSGIRDCRRPPGGHGMLRFIFVLLMLITLPHSVLALLTPKQLDSAGLELVLDGYAPIHNSPLLECLQVSPPVLNPAEPICQQTLMVHTFGWSYGKPFLGRPPAHS
jgi:hypothetical protein